MEVADRGGSIHPAGVVRIQSQPPRWSQPGDSVPRFSPVLLYVEAVREGLEAARESFVIGRLFMATPAQGERYYLQLWELWGRYAEICEHLPRRVEEMEPGRRP
ncbi:hypothetical protein VTN49DRAFT_8089 [Thermomyces lanuginosus]|uniref:uncharacterized protein n=1 Tax=Thermomyces lanuginosus TaxID=5541 RepID=UPI0037431936